MIKRNQERDIIIPGLGGNSSYIHTDDISVIDAVHGDVRLELHPHLNGLTQIEEHPANIYDPTNAD